jgi:hypothetical protein
MPHDLLSISWQWIISRWVGVSRILLFALLPFCGSWSSAAENPSKEKADANESRGLFRSYLPTIRLKALLDNERQSVADLENWLIKYDLWLPGGLVTSRQRQPIAEELLLGRLRVLRRETAYRDSLDRFTRRFRATDEQRRQMEDEAISHLRSHIQRFKELSHDLESIRVEVARVKDPGQVSKVRPKLEMCLTESSLVKNTAFRKKFLNQWAERKTIDDTKQLLKQTVENRKGLQLLQARQSKLAEESRKLSDVDQQRLADLKFAVSLDSFQFSLLMYEKRPWEGIEDVDKRRKRQSNAFDAMLMTFRPLLESAFLEQKNRLIHSWSKLAPLKVKEVDLLAGDDDRAERTVALPLKTPDAQLAANSKVRQLRSLAKSYSIQQQLFVMSFIDWHMFKDEQMWPSSPPPEDVPNPAGLIGPIGPRPSLVNPAYAPEPLLKLESSLTRAKRLLLETWIDYQIIRLDLYGDLGMSPP